MSSIHRNNTFLAIFVRDAAEWKDSGSLFQQQEIVKVNEQKSEQVPFFEGAMRHHPVGVQEGAIGLEPVADLFVSSNDLNFMYRQQRCAIWTFGFLKSQSCCCNLNHLEWFDCLYRKSS